MLGLVIVRQLRNLERNQLAALQGTDDDLPPLSVVRNNRCNQVSKNRLQQEAGDQHPSDDRGT